ncbi:MAG: Eco47II family restriction endonuclease [Alphaproteobacteria bacterium]|nr:MAG: hypothetical protein B6I23_00660 [Rickettsiaceae bacterium 4572_127]
MKKLKWIKEEDLYLICKEIITNLENKTIEIEKDLHKNIVDPFSAIFDASFHKTSLQEWTEREKARQIQKSFQNTIGKFHQKILGKTKGWIDLGTGGIADLVNIEKKIIAEVKNKFNTTKGNHKIAIYDDLEHLIQKKHKGFTGYYVPILSKKQCDKTFTPPDNKTKTRRKENDKIREIDGASFYELATGRKDAIKELYNILPHIISDIIKIKKDKITKDPLFEELFTKAFK